MKIIVSFVAMGAVCAAANVYAAGTGYSGTGETRGYTSKTGFVKERGNDADKMGQDNASGADADSAKGNQEDPEDGDVPPSDDNNGKNDNDKGED